MDNDFLQQMKRQAFMNALMRGVQSYMRVVVKTII